jgi:hypothetical protein
LLGLQAPWKVTSVDLNVEVLQVDIHMNYESGSSLGPECGKAFKPYDQSAKRSWRHLDTIQFATHLHSQSHESACTKNHFAVVTNLFNFPLAIVIF